MARLDMYVNYELKASFRLDDNEVMLGREAECAVRIPDGKVSRKHAVIKFLDGERIIENLGVNGTKVNGVDVDAPSVLKAGDAIFIANYILVYQPDEEVEQDLDGTTIINRAVPKNLVL